MNVKRVTLDGTVTKVQFPNVCGKWLVKNFTSGDVYASFDANMTEDNAVKIASNCGQVVVDNEFHDMDIFKHNSIYIKGTGEVEVQQICYR